MGDLTLTMRLGNSWGAGKSWCLKATRWMEDLQVGKSTGAEGTETTRRQLAIQCGVREMQVLSQRLMQARMV